MPFRDTDPGGYVNYPDPAASVVDADSFNKGPGGIAFYDGLAGPVTAAYAADGNVHVISEFGTGGVNVTKSGRTYVVLITFASVAIASSPNVCNFEAYVWWDPSDASDPRAIGGGYQWTYDPWRGGAGSPNANPVSPLPGACLFGLLKNPPVGVQQLRLVCKMSGGGTFQINSGSGLGPTPNAPEQIVVVEAGQFFS